MKTMNQAARAGGGMSFLNKEKLIKQAIKLSRKK